jgi:hypothetical protein
LLNRPLEQLGPFWAVCMLNCGSDSSISREICRGIIKAFIVGHIVQTQEHKVVERRKERKKEKQEE